MGVIKTFSEFINESIWSDIQDRSAGDTVRKEDLITTNEDLKNKIKELYNLEKIETEDLSYLSSARSISLLKQAMQSLKNADKGIDDNYPIDMVEIDIKDSWNILGEIIGETYEEELIDQLFSQFCLGK